MSDDSDASLPLPGSPPAGSDDHQDEDSGSELPLSRKIIIEMSPPIELAKSPNLPLDDIPYPIEMMEKVDSVEPEPEPEVEIPLPPDSSDSKYSPSQASAEDASPASETQQKKTVAVLGRAQAMKRLKAFSAAKLAATSTIGGSGVKKSPIKGVSVFSGKSSSDSKQPPLAIASIKEEETKLREIMQMNSILNEKLKTVHAITGSIPGPGPATAIVKPTLLNPEFRNNNISGDKSDLTKNSEEKITSFHVKKQMKNIRRKRASSTSSDSKSRSRSLSPGIKRRGAERRSRSRDRDRDRDSYRQRDRDRERDRNRDRERDRENERKRVKRSRSRSKNRDLERRRSKSPRSKEKSRRRSRSRDRKRRSRSRERKRSPSRSFSREREKDVTHREKSPVIREVKRKSVSPSPLREKKQKSLSPIPLRKSRSRSHSKELRKSHSRSKSPELKIEIIRKKSRSRSREREAKSGRKKSPSKHKKKDKDRDRERDREREKEKQLEKDRREKEEKREAERRRERERQEAAERELDKVRTSRMPTDWTEYKKFQYSTDNIRDVWNVIFPKDSKGRSRSRSRSSSRSPSRGKELPLGNVVNFSKMLIQSPALIKTVPIELKTSIKGEYPINFVKTTRQKPSLEFGCNRLSLKGYYKARDVFKEESPEVVKSVESILNADGTLKCSPPDLPKVQPWFAEHSQVFCPSEGSKGIVISHLYSDEEVEEPPPVHSKQSSSKATEKPKKVEAITEPSKSVPVTASSYSTATASPAVRSSQPEPMEEDYSTESSQSQDSVPSPLLKTRYGADLPPTTVAPLKPPDVVKEASEEEEDKEETEVPAPAKVVPPPEEKKSKTKGKKEKKKRKKKDSKKHSRRHRKDSKKRSRSDDEENSDDKNESDSSQSEDDSSKVTKAKNKKPRKEEDEAPAKSTKVVDEKKKTKVSLSKTKKRSKKNRKHSGSSESEDASSSEESKDSSSSSSESESDEKDKKKKKKRSQKKKRDRKGDKDSSDDEAPGKGDKDKGGAGGATGRSGGTSGEKSRKDKDKSKDRDRERRRSRDRDRDRDRDRGDRKKRRRAGVDVEEGRSNDEDVSSNSSSNSSYDSSSDSSSNSSSYSSASEENTGSGDFHLDQNIQLSLQIAKIQQIGMEEKTENDIHIISKFLTQLENDDIMGSMKTAGDEKYDPFIAAGLDEDINVVAPVNDIIRDKKFNNDLSGAKDLLKTFEDDPILQKVMGGLDLSAEEVLAQISDPSLHEASSPQDELSSRLPLFMPPVPTPKKKEVIVSDREPLFHGYSRIPIEDAAVDERVHTVDGFKSAVDHQDKFSRSPSFERRHEGSQHHDRLVSRRSYSRSYSRSKSRSRSRSRSRSFSPSNRRPRKIIHERRYHPYHDRRGRYRNGDRRDGRDRYSNGHRGLDSRDRDYDDRYSRYDRHRDHLRQRDRSPDSYDRYQPRRFDIINRGDKDRLYYEGNYREEFIEDRLHEDLNEKPITTICSVNHPSLDTTSSTLSPPLRLNVADSTISDSDLVDSSHAGFVDNNVEDNGAVWSNLKEIKPHSEAVVAGVSVLDKNKVNNPGYASPPKRLSLDERLEMEMGIKLREEGPPGFPYTAYSQGQDHYSAPPGPSQVLERDRWVAQTQIPPQGVQAGSYNVSNTVPRQSQAIPLGDLIQVLPGQMLERNFTVTKQSSKLNPFEVQQTAVQVIRKVGDEVDPSKCINIKVPVLPFKIPVFGHPDLEALQAAELEKENRIMLKRQKKEQKRQEEKRRQYEKRKQVLKKKMLKKKKLMARKKRALEAAQRELEEKKLATPEGTIGNQTESAVDPEELKLLKEALSEVPTNDEDHTVVKASTPGGSELATDSIVPVDDMKEADEHEEDTKANFEPASPKQPSLDLPADEPVKIILPKKGILYMTGLKMEKSSKGVKFADGVLPGHGSSRSEGEDIHSPPLGQENQVKKKKKVKPPKEPKEKKEAKPVIEIDPNAPKLPPPPPPKDPYPYCPLGILYQFNPPYAIVYAQTVAELGYEVTFTPSMETPKDFAGEQLGVDESLSVQAQNQLSSGSAVFPTSEFRGSRGKSTSWTDSLGPKDSGRKRKKHREHKDIDLKAQSAYALDSPSSRHASHRHHKERSGKGAHAQRIPTIVNVVPTVDPTEPHDFHPVDDGRIMVRIGKDVENENQILHGDIKNLISLSSHPNDQNLVSSLGSKTQQCSLPLDDASSFSVKSEFPPDFKRTESNRFRHSENRRARNRHHGENNRLVEHKNYENHRVDHHKRLGNHHLDSNEEIENHRLDNKFSEYKRSDHRHSEWKGDKGSDKSRENPNLIRISPSKSAPVKTTCHLIVTKASRKCFAETFVDLPRTPELDSDKLDSTENETFTPTPFLNRSKQPIKIKMNMKPNHMISDKHVSPSIRPLPVIDANLSSSPTGNKFNTSSPVAPNAMASVKMSSGSLTTKVASPQSAPPNVQIPTLHPPMYDYYNHMIPSMGPPITSPVPSMTPNVTPVSPRLPCGIDLTRPPPSFTSSSSAASVNASASSPKFASATRVPDVRITNSSPLRRTPQKGNRN